MNARLESRRGFLKTLAAGGLLVAVPSLAQEKPAAPPTAWVRIAPDGAVTVLSNTSEIGQGTGTAIAQILADELDLDWKTIRLEMAPVTPAYINAGWGEYATYGSGGVARQIAPLRKAAAQARAMLVSAAAAEWKVAGSECDTKEGRVVHGASGRSIPYAKLVGAAAGQPVPADPPLMPRERWRHMGRDVARLDIPGKTDGSAVYGIDVKVPGMMHAAILQCPHFGGTLSGVDERPALAMRGVKKVVRLADAVAVVADSWWRAQKAVNALKPQWNLVRASSHTSAAYVESLRKAVQADGALVVPRTSTMDKVLASYGEAAARGKEVVDRSYAVPLLSHSPMEPMNGTAHYKAGKVTLWLPTQAQDTARTLVARALNIPEAAVTVHTTLSGGGFGRRIEADFAIQAALISREAGVPVKLLWSREQDTKHGFYRPAAVLRLRAGVGADGAMTALRIDSAADSLFNYSRFGSDRQYAEPFDRSAYGHPINDYYNFGAVQFRVNTIDAGVPLGYWRSVAASQNVFAYESLVDELAQMAKMDPLAYRRRMTKEGGRDRRVIDAMIAHPAWADRAAEGRSRGVAYAKANGSYIGEIVELSVDKDKRVKLHKVTLFVDCGIAVNPRNVQSQIEGGAIFALSAAFYGAITIKDGAVEQSNFHDYRLASLADMPQFEVVILESTEAPGGVGEESVGPFAPALANAIAAATGQRLSELPLAKAGFTLA